VRKAAGSDGKKRRPVQYLALAGEHELKLTHHASEKKRKESRSNDGRGGQGGGRAGGITGKGDKLVEKAIGKSRNDVLMMSLERKRTIGEKEDG